MPSEEIGSSTDGKGRLTLAARFNAKHGADLLGQTLKIQEEAGEVAEAALAAEGRLLFKNAANFDLGDELAQLIVTAYYAAELHGVVDIDERVDRQLWTNLGRQDTPEKRCYACDTTENVAEYRLPRPDGGETPSTLCEDCADEAGVGPNV